MLVVEITGLSPERIAALAGNDKGRVFVAVPKPEGGILYAGRAVACQVDGGVTLVVQTEERSAADPRDPSPLKADELETELAARFEADVEESDISSTGTARVVIDHTPAVPASRFFMMLAEFIESGAV